MIVSIYSDDERKDKVAEFYDTVLPTVFLRGMLEESKESLRDCHLTIVSRNFERRDDDESDINISDRQTN